MGENLGPCMDPLIGGIYRQPKCDAGNKNCQEADITRPRIPVT